MDQHIRFDHADNALILLDQRLLPGREEYFVCRSVADVIHALKVMVVRGAPAIGVTAAWGCVIAALECAALGRKAGEDWPERLDAALDGIAQARPTAVNLGWAVRRLRRLWKYGEPGSLANIVSMWKAEAARIQEEDIAVNRLIGQHGASLLENGDRVMTHCNAGALATAGHGTALGVIYSALAQGKDITVIANETRPFMQGARLTAFELQRSGVAVTVACDNAAALLMKKGLVSKVIVGADRIAANGDTANKIGTYGLGLLARAHGLPLYVAAPLSTIDRDCPDGDGIPIEERPASEVTHLAGSMITPEGVPVYNFAFDVTPAGLVTGIITEQGVLAPPYARSIAEAFARALGAQSV